MFTYTTDGIVVENFVLYNILCVIQFKLFYFILIYSCGVVVLLMLYIIFLFHFISLCLLNYTLMLWVNYFMRLYGVFDLTYIMVD